MRTVGIEERYITGNAEPYEKYLAWAKTIPQLIGNPLYHWSHLELQRYFGIHEALDEQSAKYIWDKTAEMLQSDDLAVSSIFAKFKVEAVGTTDDPADDLALHESINSGNAPIGRIHTKVLPSFRPDKALLIQNAGFADYIEKLQALPERKRKRLLRPQMSVLLSVNDWPFSLAVVSKQVIMALL